MSKRAILWLMLAVAIVAGVLFVPIYYVKGATFDTPYLAGFIFVEVLLFLSKADARNKRIKTRRF